MDSAPHWDRHVPLSHIEDRRRLQDRYWWFVARREWVVALLKKYLPPRPTRPPLHLADIGGGEGHLARFLREALPTQSALVLDGDGRLQSVAEKEFGLQFSVVDVERALALPASTNVVTLLDVLEHLKEDVFFLLRLHASLSKGAVCVITVPAGPKLFSHWDEQLKHYRRYTRSSLRDALTQAGFRIEYVGYFCGFLYPFAWVRRLPFSFSPTKTRASRAQFPEVPRWLNALLIFACRCERLLSPWLSAFAGTSLIAVVRKD